MDAFDTDNDGYLSIREFSILLSNIIKLAFEIEMKNRNKITTIHEFAISFNFNLYSDEELLKIRNYKFMFIVNCVREIFY